MLDWIANRVGEQLKTKGLLLATAESCTGGWVAQAMTAIAGSSEWFERGFITYTNVAKMEMLGVRGETLQAHGAVSEQTVREMAQGALLHSRAHVAVAVSGVAGPGGGSAEKPVGMVSVAWAVRGGAVQATTLQLDGDRDAVRRASVVAALQGVVRLAVA